MSSGARSVNVTAPGQVWDRASIEGFEVTATSYASLKTALRDVLRATPRPPRPPKGVRADPRVTRRYPRELNRSPLSSARGGPL